MRGETVSNVTIALAPTGHHRPATSRTRPKRTRVDFPGSPNIMGFSSFRSGKIDWPGRPGGISSVLARKIEAFDFDGRLDPAPWAPPLDEHDEIDQFCDQAARNGRYRLLDQLFDAMERCARRVRVYGCDSTGMAGIPGLQHVEGFPAPDLTDHDPVRAQPKGRAHEIGKRCDAGFGPQRNRILGIAS